MEGGLAKTPAWKGEAGCRTLEGRILPGEKNQISTTDSSFGKKILNSEQN
ncbi:hypothetical protein TREPR_3436 [Treponema primitia ZAS-2]|uniref:Uncharacterized protein n=1 Tax=Treponema primitia (strain ATCC BAA-887 / DSM 12427 / ZAS-2) TaxID=545694 RepID=F5YJI2_TREPZ|nr:hypothetical protein TREPR_3436 [Treponema primitia ZAS-2]